jgi:AcrR family transcriptional regulator
MTLEVVGFVPASRETARERLLSASYDLFSRRGIRDVSIDEVLDRSGVAKATLYRHFPSKDELVLAFLERRERLWTHGTVEAGALARSEDPVGRLLAIFDVFDEWFQREDFEACSFINVLLEMGPAHPAGKASVKYLANIRSVVANFAAGAGLREPDEFSKSWHILMKGSIVQAVEGDTDSAKRAKAMAKLLIAEHSSQPLHS